MSLIQTLVTHSGMFHADDVCAAAVLLALHPDTPIVRTRDEAAIQELAADGIVFDVGRVYDPAARRFDHHMRGAATREDGTVYSSFGLVWQAYGRDYLQAMKVEPEHLERVFDAFDTQVVLPVDKIDNGHLSPAQIGETSGITLSEMIYTFNPPFHAAAPRAADLRFEAATQMARVFLEAKVDALEAEAQADALVEYHLREHWGEPVLELPYALNFQRTLDALDARHVLFVIQPSSSGGYGLTCARESDGTYMNLVDFPEEWAGLSGDELVKATGVEGVTFCHAGRFFAGGDNRECLRELAQLAMPEDPAPSP